MPRSIRLCLLLVLGGEIEEMMALQNKAVDAAVLSEPIASGFMKRLYAQ
jgi:ABC-type amino acid transport substrate-binding protein